MTRVVLVVGGCLLAACGSSTTTPSGGGGGNGTSATTVTISSAGVSPKTLTIARGTQVTFVNGDSRSHEMASDPHPTHENCPEINSVGLLNPNQSRQTANLNTARSCGYHDHNSPTNTALQGTLVIQ